MKIRIAVGVTQRRHWNAAGWGSLQSAGPADPRQDRELLEAVQEGLGEELAAKYFIEAELPEPTPPPAIQGTISTV